MFKNLILNFFLSLLLFGCAHGNFGFYSRETKNTYSMQVGGAVKDPKYTFQRGAYELCKKNHKAGGHEVIKKDWKYGEMGSSWIEGRIKCTGKRDDFLSNKFKGRKGSFSEQESPLQSFDIKYSLE